MSGAGVGIDVGGSRLHLVALGGDGHVLAGEVLAAEDVGDVVAWAMRFEPRRVAIDAPSALSPAVHRDDASLAPKFRVARCGEIALGREAGMWVPWVSPPAGTTDVAGWIAVGLRLFAALVEAGLEAVETFPHAAFRALAGSLRVPAKTSAEGLAHRVELLRAAGVVEPTLPLWGHDGLDACAAALVAASPDPQVLTCGHDGSSIWLPPRRIG